MALHPAAPLKLELRRLPVWLWALLAFYAVHAFMDLAYQPLPRPIWSVLNNLVLQSACLLGVWLFYRASCRPDCPPALRRVLRWAMLTLLLQALEGIVLLLMRYLGSFELHGRTWENIPLVTADVLGQISEIFLIVLLLRLPRSEKPRRGRMRIVIDAMTFIVGAGVPLWLVSLRPLLAASSSTDDLFTVIGPIVCFGGLLILSWALETRQVAPNRPVFKLLLFGAGMLLLSDIFYGVGKAIGFDGGVLIRLNFLMLKAAFVSWLLAAWYCQQDDLNPSESGTLVEFSPVPMLTIVAAASFFMLLNIFGNADEAIYPKLLTVLFVFLLILLARETFVIRDSLRLVAVEAGQKTQARYEALVRHSSDVVIVVQAGNQVQFASPAAQLVLGVAPESLLGRNLLELIHPEDRPGVEAFLARLQQEPSVPHFISWRFVPPGGTPRYLETMGSNLWHEPQIAGIVLNSRDVSERLQMEEQLRQSQKMEAIGRLAGGVAHDFNNILTALQMQLELMRQDFEHVSGLESGLDDIRESAQRAAGLTRQLLMFGRRQMVQKQSLDLHSLVSNLLKMLRRLIGENIAIEVSAAPDPIWILADAGMLEQVVMNLIVNARDAMPAGGRISLRTGLVELDAAEAASHPEGRRGRFVRLQVADTGHGMDGATLKRIFEPFFTTKEMGRGTGLGLATVYGIVKQHDGWVEVTSELNQGTCFSVYLPAALPPAASGDIEIDLILTRPAGFGMKVLLAEDDPVVRKLAATVLHEAGYEVLSAQSGSEALTLWQATDSARIQLLITDMVMPGEYSGLELARHLRHERPDLPVVVMSGYSQELSEHGLNASEQIHFLAKPFDAAGLLQAVGQSLTRA